MSVGRMQKVGGQGGGGRDGRIVSCWKQPEAIVYIIIICWLSYSLLDQNYRLIPFSLSSTRQNIMFGIIAVGINDKNIDCYYCNNNINGYFNQGSLSSVILAMSFRLPKQTIQQ